MNDHLAAGKHNLLAFQLLFFIFVSCSYVVLMVFQVAAIHLLLLVPSDSDTETLL